MYRFSCLGLAMLLAAPSYAQFAGTPAPDIGAGKKRAAACFACHNVTGVSKIPGTPHLAGQDRGYLEGALRAYRDGQTRQNATMNAMAKPLSDSDIANIAAYFSLQIRMNNGQTAAHTAEILERIRPVGNVAMEGGAPPARAGETGASAAAATRSGEAVYKASCMACHATGAAGAPKTGNRAEWSSRLKNGTGPLLQHAIVGFNAMPPRGGCASCSDAEIKAAVDYLVAASK